MLQHRETIRLGAAVPQGLFHAVRVMVAVLLSVLLHLLLLWWVPAGPGGMSGMERGVLQVRIRVENPKADPGANGEAGRHFSTASKMDMGQGPAGGLPRYYLPEELDRQPALAEGIDTEIPLPPGEAFAGSARFRLYLDAAGAVDKVVVEKSNLPREVEALLRQRFLQARATPGRLHGRPVPSQAAVSLRVEGE